MKVLVIGSGGREHALCWRLAQSPSVSKLYCAPGNPGIAGCATNVSLAVDAFEGLVDFVKRERVDLTVVGPEVPLCAGIADRFAAAGLRLFGPSAKAAELEGSKVYSKQFMAEEGIPTAAFGVFEKSDEARRHIDAHPRARVVKADGLAAGKGVVVAGTADEAKKAVQGFLSGESGIRCARVVVEDKLDGEELSLIVISDGESAFALPPCQDHKAAYDGDRGPNTGGMGTYSPAPLSAALRETIWQRAVMPTLRGMTGRGRPFRGALYLGLMIVDGEPYVLEYNCRFGDPETQVQMLRFEGDLAALLMGAAEGKLPATEAMVTERAAVCVVMATEGYPAKPRTGDPILGLDEAAKLSDVVVFHAGTARGAGGAVMTAGGRVLGVSALGDDLLAAQRRAYEAVSCIRWPGVHFRRDIGWRAVGGFRG